MNKKIIFITLSCFMVLILCGSASATDLNNTTNITQNNHVYINVSNDNGVKYNVDYDYYLNDPTQQGYNPNGTNGTYYIKAEGGGLNQLHICNSNSTSAMYGQITVTNTTSGTQSGVFYITTTGGRGLNDDIILLLSVKGPISDNFNLTIVSSGYTWIISVFGATQPPLPTNPQYVVGAVNETFTKSDFQYGPQPTRPAPGGWQPLYSGQDTSDPSTAEYLMFIDLYVGNLRSGLAQAPIDNGAVKVEYTLNNMYTTASFNAYAWTGASFQGTGINWCSPIINNANPCVVTVNYAPETPVANITADKTAGSDSLTVEFTDTSANYPTSWTWNFGDGITSTEQNPTHTYSAPGTYTVTLTATNLAGSDTVTKTSYITVLDTIAPTVSTNLAGGNYNTAQTVTLTTTDASPTTIYYTTDGTDPTSSSTQYTGPINIDTTTTLKFMAIDTAGNQGTTQTETYNIDTTAPTVQANPLGGNYNTAQSVVLTANDENPTTIYYTTDGTEPTSSNTQYTGPINIGTTTTLKFMAIDIAGNQGTVQTETYNIKSDVYVQITPSITNPQVGDQVTYTFKLGNNGPGDASNVVFTYVLPEGVEYTGANVDQGTVNYDPTTRTLTWTIENVPGGTDPYLWLNFNILNAGTFNIQPTVTVDGYNPGLINNIGALQVNAATPNTNTVNAATNTNTVQAGTIPMQTTGAPLIGLILGILCIGSGITLSRKK